MCLPKTRVGIGSARVPTDGQAPLKIAARHGRLCSELASLEWSVTSTGKILVEPKEKIKQRIGRSPDHADALALTFYAGQMPEIDIYWLGDGDDDHDEPGWVSWNNDALFE